MTDKSSDDPIVMTRATFEKVIAEVADKASSAAMDGCREGYERELEKQFARVAAASRLAALEEAAKVCEGIGDEYDRDEGHRYPELKSDAVQGTRSCEAAIRALVGKGE